MNDSHRLPLLLISAVLAGAMPTSGISKDTGTERPLKAESGAPSATHQTTGHRRGPKKIALTSAEGANLTLWKPDLTTQPLELKHGSITLPSTGMDNYHAIVAEKDWGSLKETVIRYEYLRGKPSGHTTRELTSAQKSVFEIVPQPVLREHLRYYSNETWSFLVRFEDKPVAGVPIVIETTNGSTDKGKSDDQGIVNIHIPDDFPDLREGKRDMRSADFMLYAEYSKDDITYQTALSASYRVNQSHWKSLGMGVAVIGLGMIAGGYIGRTRKSRGERS